MLKVLSNILCDLDPKVKVIGQKAGICDRVPSTSALVKMYFNSKLLSLNVVIVFKKIKKKVCIFLNNACCQNILIHLILS